MLISKCGGCDSFWIVIASLQIEFIAKKNRVREGWLAPAGFKSVNREEE